MSEKIGCGAKIQIGMGAFELCGNDYYGEPIYCDVCKTIIHLRKSHKNLLNLIDIRLKVTGVIDQIEFAQKLGREYISNLTDFIKRSNK